MLLKVSTGPPAEELPVDFNIISPPRKTPPEGIFLVFRGGNLYNEVKWWKLINSEF